MVMRLGGKRNTAKQAYAPECVEGEFSEVHTTILHGLPLWERRMAYFPALELIAKHKIWQQRINIHSGETQKPS
jgi:hypothetical protein